MTGKVGGTRQPLIYNIMFQSLLGSWLELQVICPWKLCRSWGASPPASLWLITMPNFILSPELIIRTKMHWVFTMAQALHQALSSKPCSSPLKEVLLLSTHVTGEMTEEQRDETHNWYDRARSVPKHPGFRAGALNQNSAFLLDIRNHVDTNTGRRMRKNFYVPFPVYRASPKKKMCYFWYQNSS